MDSDIKYMARAIELAQHGKGNTSPNPMVGAVVVCNNSIIGEGYHRQYGEAHAEVNAINSVNDKNLLSQSTIYVTLEPCSHYGKTPPCAQLIIDNKIPRVVVGCLDPFEKVSGRGIKMLQDAGIDVITGILEKECREINPIFMTAHSQRRPWITLKWAQSQDNYIDCKRTKDENAFRFSNDITSMLVHRLRSLHDAIMIGSNTALVDNPQLNVRKWAGRNPIRIIVDRRNRIPANHQVLNHPDTIHYTRPDDSINDIATELYNQGITSVLVEGGSLLLQSFIDRGLWDCAQVEISADTLGEHGNIKAPQINKQPIKLTKIDKNTLCFYSNNPLFKVKNL